MEKDSNKIIEDLRHKVYHGEQMEKERAISDKKYADKLVEKIVFGMVALILVTVVGAIIALVVNMS